eukprot:7340597-Alexandrium_andersonii.AAC.1
MSASLVGSEMCIRDRRLPRVPTRVIGVPVEGAPSRAGWTPDEQARASSSQRPDDEVTVLRLAE